MGAPCAGLGMGEEHSLGRYLEREYQHRVEDTYTHHDYARIHQRENTARAGFAARLGRWSAVDNADTVTPNTRLQRAWYGARSRRSDRTSA